MRLGICVAVAGAALVGGWFLGAGANPLLLVPVAGLIAATEGLRQTIAGVHGARRPHPAPGADPATRTPDDDAVVPRDARPGWIYEDTSGRHAMVVSTPDGYRLVGLPDFVLVGPGQVSQLRKVSGAAQITVLPLSADA